MLFERIATEGLERGKYLQKHYATLAMKRAVAEAHEAPSAVGAAERQPFRFHTLRAWLGAENKGVAMVLGAFGAIYIGWLFGLWLIPAEEDRRRV